jgi:hypothetical protein
MLRIVAQAVLKTIEPFGFYRDFSETTPKSSFLPKDFYEFISRQWLNPMT